MAPAAKKKAVAKKAPAKRPRSVLLQRRRPLQRRPPLEASCCEEGREASCSKEEGPCKEGRR